MIVYMGFVLSFFVFLSTMFVGMAIAMLKNTRISVVITTLAASAVVAVTWNLTKVFNIDQSILGRWVLVITMEILGFITGWCIGNKTERNQN